MGNKRKFAYKTAQEDEYVYNCLVNYPDWAKRELQPRELKIFKTTSSIRSFVRTASSDQKMLLLAKANIHCVKLYVDMNKEEPLTLQNFNKLYKQFGEAEKRAKIIKEIQEKNSFAVSSREVLSAAYLIAQNCHTPYWFVNLDYKKVHDALTKLKASNLKDYDGQSDKEKLKEINNYRDIVIKFLWSFLDAENYMKIVLKMEWIELHILLVLFYYRDTMLERTVILKLLSQYAPGNISAWLGKMLREGLLDVNRSNHKKPCYTIAELGIIRMSMLLEKISSQATNV